MNRTAKRYGVPRVIFPHWAHRVQFTCQACHPTIFRMEAGAHEILMERMAARRTFCLACHDGRIAWNPVNCSRCHRGQDGTPALVDAQERTLPGVGPPFFAANRDPDDVLREFPRDAGGNIDWIEAVRQRIISPRASLTGHRPGGVTAPPDTVMARTENLPPVVFSHRLHAVWLDCGNCHPDPFVARKAANRVSMAKILAGQYCGKCHGKVAFPITYCGRCHRGPSSHENSTKSSLLSDHHPSTNHF